MVNSLSRLDEKFEALNKGLDQGKIISTSLEAESKPSQIKRIVLNIITFGWYCSNYKSRYNPEQVFTNIKKEVKQAIEDCRSKMENNDVCHERSLEELKQENANLERIKKALEDQEKGDEFKMPITQIKSLNSSSFKEESLVFKASSVILENQEDNLSSHQEIVKSLRKVYLDVFKKKIPDSELKQMAFKLANEYATNRKEHSLAQKENRALAQLLSDPNECHLEVFFDFIRKTYTPSITSGESYCQIMELSLPKVTNDEIIKNIDNIIKSNSNKITCINGGELEISLANYKKNARDAIEQVVGKIESIFNAIWKKSKDTETKTNKINELNQIKDEFISSISKIVEAEDSSSRFFKVHYYWASSYY